MTPRISIDSRQIAAFCLKWKICEMSLFGSVLRDDFRPDGDVDVLVSFEPSAGWGLFDLIEMKEELGRLFGRQVHLIERAGVRNPFRRHSILTTRHVIYAS